MPVLVSIPRIHTLVQYIVKNILVVSSVVWAKNNMVAFRTIARDVNVLVPVVLVESTRRATVVIGCR